MVRVSGVIVYAGLSVVLCSYFAAVNGRNCDELGVNLYDTLGCTPKSRDSDGCASEYECDFPKDNATCYFKGKHYKEGDMVIPYGAPCNGECTCRVTPQGAGFSCSGPKCNFTNMELHLEPGCYRYHEPGYCCPTRNMCHGKDDIHKCVVDGIEYNEGISFQVKEKCKSCTCTKFGPVCHGTACGEWTQLYLADSLRNHCAPVYLEDRSYPKGLLCCSHTFYCPKGTEVIKPSDSPNPDGKFCKFGTQILKFGDRFDVVAELEPTSKWHIDCECILPPFVTCKERKAIKGAPTDTK